MDLTLYDVTVNKSEGLVSCSQNFVPQCVSSNNTNLPTFQDSNSGFKMLKIWGTFQLDTMITPEQQLSDLG
jgi:hypothetical protein